MSVADLEPYQLADIRAFADRQTCWIEREKLHALLDAYEARDRAEIAVENLGKAVDAFDEHASWWEESRATVKKCEEQIDSVITLLKGNGLPGAPIPWPTQANAEALAKTLTEASEALFKLCEEMQSHEEDAEGGSANFEEAQDAAEGKIQKTTETT